MIIVLVKQDKGLESKVSSHFGRARYLALLSKETLELKEIIKNENHHFGGLLSPPRYYSSLGKIVIAKEIGNSAFHSAKNFGLTVYLGAKDTLEETIDAYKKNRLRLAKEGDPDIHPTDVSIQKKTGKSRF